MTTVINGPTVLLPGDQCGTSSPYVLSQRSFDKTAVVKRSEWALRKSQPGIYVPPTGFTYSGRNARFAIKGYRRGGTFKCDGQSTLGAYYAGDVYDPNAANPLRNRALIQARSQLKGQNVNLAQAFAERKQTAGLVASTAGRLARSFLAVRHGNFSGAAAALGLKGNFKSKAKAVGDRWLELQYGWKPLLGDVYGSMKALHENDMAQPDRYRVSVRGSASETTTKIINSSVSGQAGDQYVRTLKNSVRTRLDYYQANPFVTQANSLGLTDPLSLAWELLPWSFVVDWFVPVGQYLTAVGATAGWGYLGGHSTFRSLGTCVIFDHGPLGVSRNPPDKTLAADYLVAGGSSEGKVVQRIVYTTNPMPRFPGIKNPVSFAHVSNALALMASAFGRKA